MYDNIGEKIQTLAKVIGWFFLIAGIIAFFVCITDGTEVPKYSYYGSKTGTEFVANTANDFLGWVALVAGVIGFCSSWILYGFGELIQEATSIRIHLTEIEKTTIKMQHSTQALNSQINNSQTISSPTTNSPTTNTQAANAQAINTNLSYYQSPKCPPAASSAPHMADN